MQLRARWTPKASPACTCAPCFQESREWPGVSTSWNAGANNYLGLSNHPRLVAAAHRALDDHGFGLSSVRFICGTQDAHRRLEAQLADFHHQEAAILYPSCFDANAGLFEARLRAIRREHAGGGGGGGEGVVCRGWLVGWMGGTRNAVGVGWAAHAHHFAHTTMKSCRHLNIPSIKWCSVDICGICRHDWL